MVFHSCMYTCTALLGNKEDIKCLVIWPDITQLLHDDV